MAKVIYLWEECARQSGITEPEFQPYELPAGVSEAEFREIQADPYFDEPYTFNEQQRQEFLDYTDKLNSITQFSKTMEYTFDNVDLLIREVNSLKARIVKLEKMLAELMREKEEKEKTNG
jgi:predicted RNase H-like nuclease (RuvC/YqgF family)